MSYRYVIFPRGRQPTVDEVHQLRQFAPLLANHVAYGACRNDGRLAIAFDAAAFDRALAIEARFTALIEKWRARGAETVNHLGFVKDASALKPVRSAGGAAASPTKQRDAVPPPARMIDEARLSARRMVAHESVARSLLGVDRTLQRYAAVERVAAAFPYILMAAAIAATATVGLYIRGQLAFSGREPRQQAIERVLEDPGDESPEAAEKSSSLVLFSSRGEFAIGRSR